MKKNIKMINKKTISKDKCLYDVITIQFINCDIYYVINK